MEKRFYEEILKEDGNKVTIIDEVVDGGGITTKMGLSDIESLYYLCKVASTYEFTGRIIVAEDKEILCNRRFLKGLLVETFEEMEYGTRYSLPCTYSNGLYTRGLKEDPLYYVSSLSFNDDSEYDSSRCHDGGAYSYSVIYDRVKDPSDGVDELWAVYYDTSCTEFDYCSLCGQFGHTEDECGMKDPDFITTDELIRLVRDHISEYGMELNDDEYITVEYFDRDNYCRKEGDK